MLCLTAKCARGNLFVVGLRCKHHCSEWAPISRTSVQLLYWLARANIISKCITTDRSNRLTSYSASGRNQRNKPRPARMRKYVHKRSGIKKTGQVRISNSFINKLKVDCCNWLLSKPQSNLSRDWISCRRPFCCFALSLSRSLPLFMEVRLFARKPSLLLHSNKLLI